MAQFGYTPSTTGVKTASPTINLESKTQGSINALMSLVESGVKVAGAINKQDKADTVTQQKHNKAQADTDFIKYQQETQDKFGKLAPNDVEGADTVIDNFRAKANNIATTYDLSESDSSLFLKAAQKSSNHYVSQRDSRYKVAYKQQTEQETTTTIANMADLDPNDVDVKQGYTSLTENLITTGKYDKFTANDFILSRWADNRISTVDTQGIGESNNKMVYAKQTKSLVEDFEAFVSSLDPKMVGKTAYNTNKKRFTDIHKSVMGLAEEEVNSFALLDTTTQGQLDAKTQEAVDLGVIGKERKALLLQNFKEKKASDDYKASATGQLAELNATANRRGTIEPDGYDKLISNKNQGKPMSTTQLKASKDYKIQWTLQNDKIAFTKATTTPSTSIDPDFQKSVEDGMNRAIDEQLKTNNFTTVLDIYKNHGVKGQVASLFRQGIGKEETRVESVDKFMALNQRDPQAAKELVGNKMYEMLTALADSRMIDPQDSEKIIIAPKAYETITEVINNPKSVNPENTSIFNQIALDAEVPGMILDTTTFKTRMALGKGTAEDVANGMVEEYKKKHFNPNVDMANYPVALSSSDQGLATLMQKSITNRTAASGAPYTGFAYNPSDKTWYMSSAIDKYETSTGYARLEGKGGLLIAESARFRAVNLQREDKHQALIEEQSWKDYSDQKAAMWSSLKNFLFHKPTEEESRSLNATFTNSLEEYNKKENKSYFDKIAENFTKVKNDPTAGEGIDTAYAGLTLSNEKKDTTISIVNKVFDGLLKNEGASGDTTGIAETGILGLTTATYKDMVKKYSIDVKGLGEEKAQKLAIKHFIGDLVGKWDKKPGFDKASDKLKELIVDSSYNAGESVLGYTNLNKELAKLGTDKGSEEAVAKQLLDTAQSGGKSMKGIAARRARAYNTLADKPIATVEQKEDGTIIYKDKKGTEIFKYTPKGGKHKDSTVGVLPI